MLQVPDAGRLRLLTDSTGGLGTPALGNAVAEDGRGLGTSPHQHHLDMDFLNMRLSFSLFAVQQACAALAAVKACSA